MTMIEKAALHRDGPLVSRLCLGTMMFGDQADAAESAAMLDGYLAAGGDFIDTADVYTDGASERILGDLLQGRRGDVLLATKVGNAMPSVPGSGGLSRDWVLRAADASLARLRTDVIDLYWLHKEDAATPLEQTIAAVAELAADGRIRRWGVSNFRGWRIAEAVRIADAIGAPRPVACQPYHHALNRQAEIEVIPACIGYGMGVVPYSPLARGVLTGKYRAGPPEGSRAARGDVRMMETEFRPETLAAAARIADHAEATGRTPAGLALAWLLANRAISSVLIGPKDRAQLTAYLADARTAFGPADEAFFDAVCPAGCAPAPHYADPRYPYRGRVTGGAS